uniref:Tail sheath protein C-terminal domain-containing protein n=1 Tax=Candidatus Kentrum sp. SD TaxID=2126332 RepID=A0A450Y4L7_9GAMM|nr:MAG: hypothetical protein BECKSD772F_GA0070984_100223 [Candidatus Kentron sp. SD]VFK39156.1 MAG: hypothetical protein BECKSD772E_GA0070983_100223 [Candidatus Kentron sp. SD]VFK77808.1 MAG: hypothetical protein BECKSD772D_GA0070982_100222 [Candidatus Kentron sp. SD]
MATYKTPGVYVEEISTFPPSVAEVSTAIPAFIGHTGKGAPADGAEPVVKRINTLIEYENIFGKAKPAGFKITTATTDGVEGVTKVERVTEANKEFLMHYGLDMYFKNGGGACYVVSVDDYDNAPTKAKLEAGLSRLEKEDEPTLIVFPDAMNLAADQYHPLCQTALAQCKKLGDRFAILDVLSQGKSDKVSEEAGAFRSAIGTKDLMYGAAYYPHIETSIGYRYEEGDIEIHSSASEKSESKVTLASIKDTKTALYNQIKTKLDGERVTLPPSPAIAGVYAQVDRNRGVWKAPANVSISAAIGPAIKITHEDQEGLNVDPTAGKSINAIRAFTGKGILIWGARTLAGNDNEWRYVPVRRLFNMIEESTQKATAFAVFEPNDANTWLKVKAMIESYLYGLWQKGALAGPTSEAAYFVNVGLGKTMTPQDVLEGRMIVEMGIAAVRPAEFIILRFSHKMQEA